MALRHARFEKPSSLEQKPPFVPAGEYRSRAADFDYVEEEWFASGADDKARSYKTQIVVRRPRNTARFSGTILVEPLHVHGVAPIYMYSSPYILRSGHGWVCVASQKIALDTHVKPAAPEHYASLQIDTDPAPTDAPKDLVTPPFRGAGDRVRGAWWAELKRYNASSSTILAQVGAALRSPMGPFASYHVSRLLLIGHSQTGFVCTNFIRDVHSSHRRAEGAPVYDGYFPSGFPARAFGPCDVPIVQTMSDGDISSPNFSFEPGFEGRQYRRPDSDDANDRYRLYELAGVPHMGTRYPPHADPHMWQAVATSTAVPLDAVMNSLPHHELFNMSLHHLVQWVASGITPPRADRIEVSANGYFAKDEYGNSRGGVRCVQMDVPRATYYPNPPNPDGTPSFGTVGLEAPFDEATMRRLYREPADYLVRFNRRLDELIGRGWLLAEDAEGMRAEARAQRW
jgi:hypothetical protein